MDSQSPKSNNQDQQSEPKWDPSSEQYEDDSDLVAFALKWRHAVSTGRSGIEPYRGGDVITDDVPDLLPKSQDK